MSDDDRRAIDAMARVLGEIEELLVDPRALAAQLLLVLRGLGWKHTNARAAQPWQPTDQPMDPDIARRCAEAARHALDEALERAAQIEGTHHATKETH